MSVEIPEDLQNLEANSGIFCDLDDFSSLWN